MPKTYKLTWNAKQHRWFKKYQGKQYAFGFGPHSTKENSYGKALLAWEAKRAEIDSANKPPESPPDFGRAKLREYYQGQLEAAQGLQALYQGNGNEQTVLNCFTTIATLQGMLECHSARQNQQSIGRFDQRGCEG